MRNPIRSHLIEQLIFSRSTPGILLGETLTECRNPAAINLPKLIHLEKVDLNGSEQVLLCCYATNLSESSASSDIAVATTRLEVEECVGIGQGID
jgi:hypothetical protein